VTRRTSRPQSAPPDNGEARKPAPPGRPFDLADAGDGPPPDSAAAEPDGPTNTTSTPTAGHKPSPPKSDADAIRTLRKVGGFRAQSMVGRRQLVIPACRPDVSWFVRVHPNPDYTREGFVIDWKDRRLTYPILDDDVQAMVQADGEKLLKLKRFALAINRQGDLFIWECAAEWEGDRRGLWTTSICELMDLARDQWVKVVPSTVSYELGSPNGTLPDPVWPDRTFDEAFGVAYKGRIITSYDDKVLRELRGEV
jgi:hypothetical protein